MNDEPNAGGTFNLAKLMKEGEPLLEEKKEDEEENSQARMENALAMSAQGKQITRQVDHLSNLLR